MSYSLHLELFKIFIIVAYNCLSDHCSAQVIYFQSHLKKIFFKLPIYDVSLTNIRIIMENVFTNKAAIT